MTLLWSLLGNLCLVAPLTAWVSAQLLKFILNALGTGKFRGERLWGSGGMPSAHSATVCALSTTIGIVYGLDSGVFALSVVFSLVVMYDACGVRREAGRHAVFLNELSAEREPSGAAAAGKPYHELVGHTLPQVIAGAALGIAVGVLFSGLWGVL